MEKDKLLKTFKDVAFLSAQKAVDIIKGMRCKANGFASLDSNGKILSSELNINYAGSSTAGGSATTADKLSTARNIALTNDLTGSVNFDGSGNVSISAANYYCSVGSQNKSNYPWHRIAYVGKITSSYQDKDAILSIRKGNSGGGYGILKVSLRTNSSPTISEAKAEWIIRKGFNIDDVKVAIYNVFGETYADLFFKAPTYARTTVYQMHGNRQWYLVSSNEVSNTTTTDRLTSYECYASIEEAGTMIHNQAYSVISDAYDVGVVRTACRMSNTSTIGSSTRPVYFSSDGVPVATTYTLGKSVPSDAVFTDTTDLSSMTGTLPASKGGTGKTSLLTSANALINALESGNSSPTDASCFVAQGTGDYSNNYYRKPMSYLWNYIKGKTDLIYAALTHSHAISDVIDLQTALDGKASSSHTHSSYVNQNAFSTVKVGSTSVSADTATDTLTLTAGNNVTITPDATNDKITISSNHPTISKSTDTTSSTSPSAGDTFTTVDSVTRDTNGHVTKVNTKTVTLPSTSVATDSSLNATSTKPIQNKAVTAEFAKYLPLTGGTIDGLMTANSGIVAKGDIVDYSSMMVSGQNSAMNSVNPAIRFSTGNTVGSPSNAALLLADIPTNSTSIKTRMYTNIDTGSNFGILQVESGNNARTEISLSYNNFKVISGGQSTFNESFCAHMYGVTCMNTKPKANNTYTLGDGTYRWKQLFANTTTINTSDRRLKKDINLLSNNDNWINFFMKLQPVSFLFKENESGRTHVGFISQDVEDAMTECGLTSLDFAGFCKDHKVEIVEEIEEVLIPADEENGIEEHTEKISRMNKKPVFDENGEPVYIYSLRYEEFIALNTMMIQKMYEKNVELENRLKIIEEKLEI